MSILKRNYLFESDSNNENESIILEIFMTDNNPIKDKPKGKSIMIIEIRNQEGAKYTTFSFREKLWSI